MRKTKWEYHRIFLSTSDPPMTEIEKLGDDGWEMFWREASAQWYAYWFKRPTIED